MVDKPHARAFDLPGWPCPPRVRDIPHHENSWGWIAVGSHLAKNSPVAQDELGYLWVNGDFVPKFQVPEENHNPGAVVFFDDGMIGLWIHPKSLRYLPSISRLDMGHDEWVPVNVVAAELPEHIREMS
ncbi:hypothetical protein ACH4YO_37970 [Streptomyces noursei]|uniref:hypothetical protein n=1 Tax=Streptomyces noursei TaxID=1971 RepID=UPI00081C5CBD|nr:hypothetical protein SNOUR_00410 [Streptomyces noursei ATCC 11455]ANZ21930.1 hypothetical protein SNOUR_43540 [Streptomyces noursei ATCC 11455]MCZ0996525.1 hypothetical protein [Streptomyces noursei]